MSKEINISLARYEKRNQSLLLEWIGKYYDDIYKYIYHKIAL